ncbi:MAG: hypothetical protein WDO24_25855 [Pseudomonadota bacterium]
MRPLAALLLAAALPCAAVASARADSPTFDAVVKRGQLACGGGDRHGGFWRRRQPRRLARSLCR